MSDRVSLLTQLHPVVADIPGVPSLGFMHHVVLLTTCTKAALEHARASVKQTEKSLNAVRQHSPVYAVGEHIVTSTRQCINDMEDLLDDVSRYWAALHGQAQYSTSTKEDLQRLAANLASASIFERFRAVSSAISALVRETRKWTVAVSHEAKACRVLSNYGRALLESCGAFFAFGGLGLAGIAAVAVEVSAPIIALIACPHIVGPVLGAAAVAGAALFIHGCWRMRSQILAEVKELQSLGEHGAKLVSDLDDLSAKLRLLKRSVVAVGETQPPPSEATSSDVDGYRRRLLELTTALEQALNATKHSTANVKVAVNEASTCVQSGKSRWSALVRLFQRQANGGAQPCTA